MPSLPVTTAFGRVLRIQVATTGSCRSEAQNRSGLRFRCRDSSCAHHQKVVTVRRLSNSHNSGLRVFMIGLWGGFFSMRLNLKLAILEQGWSQRPTAVATN